MSKYINSRNLAILISLFILVTHYIIREFNYNHWSNMLGWDVLAYYIYLPSTFIYGDPGMVDQSVIDHIFQTYNPSGTFYQAFQLPNGNWSSIYTLGYAVLYAPFFFIGHIWALISDFPADGFSFPYQFSIANGVMIYIVLGIFLIRKVLLKFFSDGITMMIMLFILLGTNFFHESIADECGPHAMMFACFALILYLNILWHEKPKGKIAFWLGLVLGLSILARGSSIVILIIIILWNVYNKKTLLDKVQLIKNNWKHLIIGLVGLSVFPIIQVIFWKKITGEFIFNTYQVTPGFDWLEPHVIKVLFSYKKGWLIYTPMIAFPVIGLFFIRKYNKNIFLPLILFFLFNFYLISSYGTWWQGTGYGSRYFVESYAVMAIPFGYLIKWIRQYRLLTIVFVITALFFLFLSLFQTWQANNWIIDGYRMTKAYYWRVFLKTKVSAEDRKLCEIERTFKAEETFSNPQDYTKHTAGFLDFESRNTIDFDFSCIDTTVFYSAPNSYKITAKNIYGPTFKIPYYKLTKREHAWIRVSFMYFTKYDMKESPASLVIEMDHNKGKYIEKYRNWNIEKFDYKNNQWNSFSVDYLTPYPLSVKKDIFKIYVYVRGAKELFIDDMHVEVFERKW
jgi:hypothetical protein